MRSPDGAKRMHTATPLAGRRVVIVVENLPVPFDRRVWLEARTLAAAGADVAVVCPRGEGYAAPFELRENVRIYRHPAPPEGKGALGYLREYGLALLHEARLLLRLYLTRGFDVIHLCNPPDLLFLVALPFRWLGCRVVFDHHDISPELYEAKFGRRGLLWRVLLMCERATFNVAHIVLATNESYRQIAMERGGKSSDEIFVVRSGPMTDELKPVAPRPGFKKGRRHLVAYVGVMGEQEGIDLLLEAMHFLVFVCRRDDVHLALAGTGARRADLEALARDLGLTDRVDFLGRVPDESLFALLSTADVCVNPDRVNRMNDLSTMNKIMEYMAFGKPIVQFDVREGRVSAGAAALYARPNDATDFARCILDLLDDEPRRSAMGAEGRRRVVENLSWPTQAPRLLAAYEQVFAKRRRLRRRPLRSKAEPVSRT